MIIRCPDGSTFNYKDVSIAIEHDGEWWSLVAWDGRRKMTVLTDQLLKISLLSAYLYDRCFSHCDKNRDLSGGIAFDDSIRKECVWEYAQQVRKEVLEREGLSFETAPNVGEVE